jgi:hypothetical protein
MAIHDYSTRGEYVPPQVIEQAKQFIERNREALLAFWHCEIGTEEFIKRLQPPPP